ncbi:MAG: hypothetical protein PHN47_08065 [Clostridia bacterium]|jgi:phage terminase large subunit-like protein|nr:hypothetical protein [Clostridia bacterium]
MTKQGIKRSEIRQEVKNLKNPVPKLQAKANHKQKINSPTLTDNTRVVFSEEINRDSNLDDG